MQHSNQQTLEQCRDRGRRARARSPTAVLEQLRDRIRSISQDMHALNRSCRWDGNQHPLGGAFARSEKRACSDTTEESSSADQAEALRKRARYYKESSPCSLMHIQSDTPLHLHITTFRMYDRCSHDT